VLAAIFSFLLNPFSTANKLNYMKSKIFFLFVLLFLRCAESYCQTTKVTKHENVVYGMISGMALLMDVYEPANSNHIGIIFIVGSGSGYWAQEVYNHVPLKDYYYLDSTYSGKWAQTLGSKGYTVFMINHRYAPSFHYRDIFSDCQRAVRFVRYHARKYDIDPDHIGAMGHSSGATLSSMLGVTDTTIVNAENGIDSFSSKVQAVVSLAATFILSDYNMKTDTAIQNNLMLRIMSNYVGELPEEKNGKFILSGKYAEASPITYISKDDAAFLIYYSDNDPIAPPRQAPSFYNKLIENNVPAKIVVCHHCEHKPLPDMNEVDEWFKTYLR
jgi:acetyl esterase/lipase